MALRWYSKHHDSVLAILRDFVVDHLPPTFSMSADLPDKQYSFPQHIVPTDMRSDLVWWSDSTRELGMLELTLKVQQKNHEGGKR